MKISIHDFILICLGSVYGTYEIFINQKHRYSYEIAGILSFVLSLWIAISCARSLKGKTKL
jgi:hypothetical protein